jgi:hypothetical protein
MADAVYQSPPLLVFVHIPKTAGTTLRGILNMSEPGARSRALGNVFKGGGGLSTASLERHRDGKGQDIKPGVRLVRGHFPLGIREYLPKERELRCFTFLREPIERTLSHYYAIRAVGGAYRLPPLPPEATLDDALTAGYIHDNLHTRMLCGDPEPFGEVNEEMLEAAKRNLGEELVFFGLTERFDESLVLAKRRLGLKAILYRSSGRVNPERPRGDQVPAEVRRSAERCNRYDIELYRHGKELFEQALESRDLEFEVDLAALQAAKTDGEPEVKSPVPESFGGDEDAWEMLVRATATGQRLDWERSRHRIPHLPPTVQAEALESELKAARSQATRLEREIERLSDAGEEGAPTATVKRLEREVETLKGARSDAKKFQREVERLREGAELRAVRAKATELEQEVEALKAVRSRAKRLEQEVDLLKGTRARAKRLEGEVEHLRAASSRADELEAEVERLRAAVTRTEKLERQIERLNDVRSRNKELQGELQRLKVVASSKAAELKRDVERLQVAAAKTEKLERQIERLNGVRSRNKELQADLRRLNAAPAKIAELEREIGRQQAIMSRQASELEQRTERLKATQSRKQKLEQRMQRLRETNGPGRVGTG